MKELSTLGLQRIAELSEEVEKMLRDVGSKIMHPNSYSPLTFDEVCNISAKVREIESWAEAIETNEE